MPNENSPEYRTIVQCTPELKLAFEDDSELDTLSGELVAATLVTRHQATDITNRALGGGLHRAGQLVALITGKVSLEIENYRSFVQVLMQRQVDHKDILDILDKKYKELGGQLETGYHLTSVGFGPTRTCTPPNTEATSIKEFTASSLGKDSRTQPGEPNSSTEPVEEKSLDQPIKNGLGKEGGAQSGEPRLPKEPVTKELEPLPMDDDLFHKYLSKLERKFLKIHEQFVSDVLARKQLKFKDVRLAMMSLPEKLRGYREVIRTKHGTLSDVKDKTELFFLLNYCFSFIDIELLNHCIDKWGTDGLKKRMKKYEKKLEQFMEQTTVRRLIKYLPGHRGPPEGRKSLEDALPGAAIDWKLSKIDKRRKRRCAKLQLSEIVSCLIGMNQYDIKEDCSIGSANHNSEHVDTDIDKKIEEFDKQKTALIEKILSELQQSVDFRPAHLLQALAVLPLRLRKQYNGEQLYSEVCKLQQKDVDGVFWTLCFGPLVDYYLLEYIVLKFGSPDLKKEMDLYSGGIQDFMKHTTVKQLLSSSWHVPAEDCGSKLPELVREMLDNCDPEVTFLKQLDTLQRRCGSNAKLSVLVDYAVLIHYDRDSDSESYTSDSEASC